MSDNVRDWVKSDCSTFVAYSLALDESTDMKDTIQLAIFIRGVTAALKVHEEFLQIVPLHDTSTGQDIFNALLQCVEHHSLDLSRLVCVMTEGVLAMIGENKGAVSLLVYYCKALGHNQTILKLHCIIHQESLCAKSANLVEVMSVVVKVVNSILSQSLKQCQFQALMDEVNAHYGDLYYFCEVRWLSRGAMLSRVWDLQQEIFNFLHEKNLPYADNFTDLKWLARLAFLTDITTHLNILNVNLQGKDVLVPEMYSHITAFEVKLCLWEFQLSNGQFQHFPCLAACSIAYVDLETCGAVITSLREEFSSRFGIIRLLSADFKLFSAHFEIRVDDAPASLQMELVDMQCSDELKAKIRTFSPLSFFHDVILPSGKFPQFVKHAQRIVAMFRSTFCCEQLFSKMKYTKSHLRSQLSDRHLNDILRLSTSSVKPDTESLIHCKQHHPSH